MGAPLEVALPVVVLTALALRADVKTRRIPNLLTGPALLLGLGVHLARSGPEGLGGSLLGMLLAAGVLLPGWLLGWMGAGDVKLMAAVGAWLGHPLGALATLFALLAGGVTALVEAARRGVLKQSLWNAAALGSWVIAQAGRGSQPPVTTGIRFPFALAALVGSLAACWVRM